MDNRLRDLERRATEDPSYIESYLLERYRSGHYRRPTRKQIQAILRRQMREYRGTHRYDPRFHYPCADQAAAMNKSHLQHPDEVGEWSGDYGEWYDALKKALPGEEFEVSTYYLSNGDLDNVVSLRVPEEITYYGNKYYGPPPGFESFRRNPDERFRELERDYRQTGSYEEEFVSVMVRSGLLQRLFTRNQVRRLGNLLAFAPLKWTTIDDTLRDMGWVEVWDDDWESYDDKKSASPTDLANEHFYLRNGTVNPLWLDQENA